MPLGPLIIAGIVKPGSQQQVFALLFGEVVGPHQFFHGPDYILRVANVVKDV